MSITLYDLRSVFMIKMHDTGKFKAEKFLDLEVGGGLVLIIASTLLVTTVDWSGRHEDSCGSTRQGRHHRRLSAEELEKRKRLGQPRQALEGWQMKSFFDFN
jgi:hypothetical protein